MKTISLKLPDGLHAVLNRVARALPNARRAILELLVQRLLTHLHWAPQSEPLSGGGRLD